MVKEKNLVNELDELDEEILNLVAGGDFVPGGIIEKDERLAEHVDEFIREIINKKIDLERYKIDKEYRKAIVTQIIKSAGDVASAVGTAAVKTVKPV